MFMPKYLAIGAVVAGLVGGAVYLSRDSEIWMDHNEIVMRAACERSVTSHLGKPADKVSSYMNAAGGYTVFINIEEGPSLITGQWEKKPTAKWGAECGTDQYGDLFFLGLYDIEHNDNRVWAKFLGWQRLDNVLEKMVPEKLREPTRQELKDSV